MYFTAPNIKDFVNSPTIEINTKDQDYAIYTFNQKDDNNKIKDYVSRVRIENGEYYFDTITDESEWEMVKNIISKLEEGEK